MRRRPPQEPATTARMSRAARARPILLAYPIHGQSGDLIGGSQGMWGMVAGRFSLARSIPKNERLPTWRLLCASMGRPAAGSRTRRSRSPGSFPFDLLDVQVRVDLRVEGLRRAPVDRNRHGHRLAGENRSPGRLRRSSLFRSGSRLQRYGRRAPGRRRGWRWRFGVICVAEVGDRRKDSGRSAAPPSCLPIKERERVRAPCASDGSLVSGSGYADPLRPDAVDVGVVQPEDRVFCGCLRVGHDAPFASDETVNDVVGSLL